MSERRTRGHTDESYLKSAYSHPGWDMILEMAVVLSETPGAEAFKALPQSEQVDWLEDARKFYLDALKGA